MLLHFVLAVLLSQGVIVGDAEHAGTGVFEKVAPSVSYVYPDSVHHDGA